MVISLTFRDSSFSKVMNCNFIVCLFSGEDWKYSLIGISHLTTFLNFLLTEASRLLRKTPYCLGSWDMSLFLSTSKIPVGSTALFVFSSSMKIVCFISVIWFGFLYWETTVNISEKQVVGLLLRKVEITKKKASKSEGEDEVKDLFSHSWGCSSGLNF